MEPLVPTDVTQADIDSWVALPLYEQFLVVVRQAMHEAGHGKVALIATAEDGQVRYSMHADPALDKTVLLQIVGSLGLALSSQLAQFVENLSGDITKDQTDAGSSTSIN